jgi:hypothetical protein
MAQPVNTVSRPQDLQATLEQMLQDVGFSDGDLVQVATATLGAQVRYIVSVFRGNVRFALSDGLERILHRQLVGAYWILSLEDVQAITAAQENRVEQ